MLSTRTSIKSLLAHSSPTTIFLRIIPIIIRISVQRRINLPIFFNMKQIRPIHIFFKMFKIFPQIFNSLFTVIYIRWTIFILTPLFNLMKNCPKPSFSHSVLCPNFSIIINLCTTTRLYFTGKNIRPSNVFLDSTITYKQRPLFNSYIIKPYQSSKSLFCDIVHIFIIYQSLTFIKWITL